MRDNTLMTATRAMTTATAPHADRIPWRNLWTHGAPVFALALLCYAVVATARTDVFTGTVTKVRDGDTVELRTDAGTRIEVRLNAIDAPEKGEDGARGQPYAARASAYLSDLALRKRATLKSSATDRYGRRVGILVVHTADGDVDAGLAQLQSGLAWVYPRFVDELPVQLRTRYRAAEAIARKEGLGLWRDRNPTPPWVWRAKHQRDR
jgi:endonuclease YncB( thermonuclease family)